MIAETGSLTLRVWFAYVESVVRLHLYIYHNLRENFHHEELFGFCLHVGLHGYMVSSSCQRLSACLSVDICVICASVVFGCVLSMLICILMHASAAWVLPPRVFLCQTSQSQQAATYTRYICVRLILLLRFVRFVAVML